MSQRQSITEEGTAASTIVTKSPEGRDPNRDSGGAGAPASEVSALARTSGAAQLGMKYLFTLDCEVRSTEPPPMRSGGVTRVHLAYLAEKSVVHTDRKKFVASWGREPEPTLASATEAERRAMAVLLENKDRPGIVAKLAALSEQKRDLLQAHGGDWQGLIGGLLSGSDTMLVREDGVLTFDGRATLEDRSGSDDAGFLVDVATCGVVDLKAALGAKSGREAHDAFSSSPTGGALFPKDGALPIRLSLRFELSAEAGLAAEYAAKRYVLQSLDHWKFERLARGQFVGLGSLTVEPKPFWPVKRLSLDVYEMDAFAEELSWKSSVLPS